MYSNQDVDLPPADKDALSLSLHPACCTKLCCTWMYEACTCRLTHDMLTCCSQVMFDLIENAGEPASSSAA